MRFRRRRDEKGVIAVVFAIMALVIFGFAAIAVDLGNAYQRKREVQSQADLSALSAADQLQVGQSQAVAAVAKYLKYNQKVGQDLSTIASQLQNGDRSDGEVEFPEQYKMTVFTPGAEVDFGLAQVLDPSFDSMDVTASATVAMGSAGATSAMPFYSVSGPLNCDYGLHRLTDPANGQLRDASNPVPVLQPPATDPAVTSNAELTSANPAQFAVGSSGSFITLTGVRLAAVDRVAFLRKPTETPNVFESVVAVNTNNNAVSAVPVPTEVTSTAGVWWIRVYKSSGNIGWSPVSQALPIRIGDATVESTCPGSNSGNFGSLKMPRTDSNNSTSDGWLPNNIAGGLQAPLSISIHEEAVAPWTCAPGGTGVRYSTTTGTPVLVARTNCLETDTGLTALGATNGLIKGTTLFPNGRLAGKATSSGVLGGRSCGPGGTSASRNVLSRNINNDTLSCYMTNPNMSVGTIATASYAGGAVLDPAIYSSPRFCYVPVVEVDPASGGSQKYSVTDVRPCFITGESASSTWNAQQFADGTDNGVTITNDRVTTIRVVFFHNAALPNSGPVGDYFGGGLPAAVALVD